MYFFRKVHKDFQKNLNLKMSQIQEELRAPMGVIVDQPTPGSGNTYDGNTASRFVNNINIVAEFTDNIPIFDYSVLFFIKFFNIPYFALL